MFPSSFANDPFFRNHEFSEFGNQIAHTAQHERQNGGELLPSFGRGFANMDRTFGQSLRMMDEMTHGMSHGMQMSSSEGNGQSFVQSSSVYSYSKSQDGEPEIFEAHHSNRQHPGGIREERKALRDTRKKLEKMAVGRHIGDRGHVIEKSRNMRTNDMTQHQNLIGLSEAEVDSYHREWYEKTKDWNKQRGIGGNTDHHRQAALGYKPERKEGFPRRSKH